TSGSLTRPIRPLTAGLESPRPPAARPNSRCRARKVRRFRTVRRRRIRIRTLLALLVFAATVPIAVFGGWLVARSGEHQQALVDRQGVETARAIASTV